MESNICSKAVTNELAAPYFGMDREKMVGLAYWGASNTISGYYKEFNVLLIKLDKLDNKIWSKSPSCPV